MESPFPPAESGASVMLGAVLPPTLLQLSDTHVSVGVRRLPGGADRQEYPCASCASRMIWMSVSRSMRAACVI